jgi:hypothetical protein
MVSRYVPTSMLVRKEVSAIDDFVISLRSNHPGVRAKTPRTPRQLVMLASQQLTPR